MTKLKPCPFCGGESLLRDRYINGIAHTKHYIRECRHCKATFAHWFRSIKKANEAWNRRAEPENNPLTLDELKQMDGKPVWTVGVGANKSKSYYALVMLSRKSVYTVIGDEMVQVGALCQYGKTWIAYRRKPERSEGE